MFRRLQIDGSDPIGLSSSVIDVARKSDDLISLTTALTVLTLGLVPGKLGFDMLLSKLLRRHIDWRYRSYTKILLAAIVAVPMVVPKIVLGKRLSGLSASKKNIDWLVLRYYKTKYSYSYLYFIVTSYY